MAEISAAVKQADGTLTHAVSSPFQGDGTSIHVHGTVRLAIQTRHSQKPVHDPPSK
jgi:hypothetical protein